MTHTHKSGQQKQQIKTFDILIYKLYKHKQRTVDSGRLIRNPSQDQNKKHTPLKANMDTQFF